MRHFVRSRLLLSVLGLAVSGTGTAVSLASQPQAPRAAVLPVPPNIKAEGLSPIPASIPDDLAPYLGFRRATFLGWHPTKREMLISTIFGNVPQIHSVAGPGMDRRQLTFFRDAGLSAYASYEPGGSYFVYGKDNGGGAETNQCTGSIRPRSAARSSRMVNRATGSRRGPIAPGSSPSNPRVAAGTAAGIATST